MLHYACEPFATVEDFLNCNCACRFDEGDSDQIETFIDAASDLLTVATRYQFTGRCTRTFRPCQTSGWCGCGQGLPCGCAQDALPLPGPSPLVLEVKVNGVAVDLSNFRVLNHDSLIRVGSTTRWPTRNNLSLDDDQDGTWSITVEYGPPVDLIATQAAVEIACELAKECEGRKTALPPGATGATIGGVGIQLQRRGEMIRENDGTGDLPKTARFIAAFVDLEPSTVWSPEIQSYMLHTVTSLPVVP